MANRKNDNEEQSNYPACAACKNQRKKCVSDCILRPHFPASKSDGFMAVHKIFGVANVTKMMKEAKSLVDQNEIAKSLYWEAAMWVQDPVRGPYGSFTRLQDEIRVLRELLLLSQNRNYNNFQGNMMMMNYNGINDGEALIMDPADYNCVNGGDNNSVMTVGQRRWLQGNVIRRPLLFSAPYSRQIFQGNDFVSNNNGHIIGPESNIRVTGNIGFNEEELDVSGAFSWHQQNYRSSKHDKIQ